MFTPFSFPRQYSRIRCCHDAKSVLSSIGGPVSEPAHWISSERLAILKILNYEVAWTRLGSKLHFSSSHHPKTDGQTEVVNQSLGNLLRSLIRDNTKQWDLILPHTEFAYNRSVNRTTGKSPFKVVYGRNPITPLDLVPVPDVGQFSKEWADQFEQIKETHRSIQEQIIWHNKQSKEHADKRHK
ncbi:RNA-directed DNA polymerase [Tanacetum coccineum]